MKIVPSAAVALVLGALSLADAAGAQGDPPQPAPPSIQSFPGIIINPPRALPPPDPQRSLPPDAQNSCPHTGTKLELLV